MLDDPRSELKDFGTVQFTTHNTTHNAELIITNEATPKITVASAICEAWDLDRPGLLLRVTGSVDYSSDLSAMESVLEGVVYAVSSANGFIFSTGLDFGMASLIGSTIDRERHRCQAPLIGVASWSSVQGRDQLLPSKGAAKGSKRKYADTQPDDNLSTVSLQSVHTHFILVEGAGALIDPSDSASNRLIKARVHSFTYAHALEQAVAEHKTGDVSLKTAERREGRYTPRLPMVLNGDKTTLREVTGYAEAGYGVVLLAAATGGLASALAAYLRGAAPSGEWRAHEKEFAVLKALHDAKSKSGPWPLFHVSHEVGKKGVIEEILDAATLQAVDKHTR